MILFNQCLLYYAQAKQFSLASFIVPFRNPPDVPLPDYPVSFAILYSSLIGGLTHL